MNAEKRGVFIEWPNGGFFEFIAFGGVFHANYEPFIKRLTLVFSSEYTRTWHGDAAVRVWAEFKKFHGEQDAKD